MKTKAIILCAGLAFASMLCQCTSVEPPTQDEVGEIDFSTIWRIRIGIRGGHMCKEDNGEEYAENIYHFLYCNNNGTFSLSEQCGTGLSPHYRYTVYEDITPEEAHAIMQAADAAWKSGKKYLRQFPEKAPGQDYYTMSELAVSLEHIDDLYEVEFETLERNLGCRTGNNSSEEFQNLVALVRKLMRKRGKVLSLTGQAKESTIIK